MYSDSTNAMFEATFYGRGAQFVLPIGESAGRIRTYVDDVQTYDGVNPSSYSPDLYLPGNGSLFFLNVFPTPLGEPPAWHSVRVKVFTMNTNAVPSTNSSHVLGLLQAYVFGGPN
jgi:hypothetical protein